MDQTGQLGISLLQNANRQKQIIETEEKQSQRHKDRLVIAGSSVQTHSPTVTVKNLVVGHIIWTFFVKTII